MASVNKVILLGRLGQDPELKYLPSGQPVANLSLATSERWKDKKTGETQERTEWHRVAIFGPPAEYASKYQKKGVLAYVEGQLRTRKWQDRDGRDRYTTEVVVQGFGSSIQRAEKIDQQSGQQSGQYQQREQQSRQQQTQSQRPNNAGGMDEVPF